MTNYDQDQRTVLTLDAGGTNFVFSAIQGNQEIVSPITLPANANDLNKCLDTIVNGFTRVNKQLTRKPVAISFAFPGPADYPRGIIGDLGNLPAFQGGVPLGAIIEDRLKLPVFINNDGDLFAYGEAIAGFLPYVNDLLEQASSPKRYNNLIGITLGTGFGGGIVRNGELFLGDNSVAGEVWLLRNKLEPEFNAEEGVSIRAVCGVYAKIAGLEKDVPDPKKIYDIATGTMAGNKIAAIEAYRQMAEVLGDALANVLTLIDGIVVIGGGLSGAHTIFLPAMVTELNSEFKTPAGKTIPRLAIKVYNLENDDELAIFLKGASKEIPVPGTGKKVMYDPLARTGVGISRLGTSKAIAIGAYAFALNVLDR